MNSRDMKLLTMTSIREIIRKIRLSGLVPLLINMVWLASPPPSLFKAASCRLVS